MILEDFHIHTNYCDGKNSPEEIVRAAIELGMKRMGFSCHSYTDFDESYCIKKEKIAEYRAEIRDLAKRYKDKIEILCGVEQDYYSNEPTDVFDYVIASVHYVNKNGKFFEIDGSEKDFIKLAEEQYGGDYMALCEGYFENVGDVIKKTKGDIIGHFDLVTKFNEGNRLFNTSDKRYVSVAKQAIDKLLAYNKPFEINTGAISRGYRSEAYPENGLLKYIFENGGRVILSSDSHSVDSLLGQFEVYEKIAKEIGFDSFNF